MNRLKWFFMSGRKKLLYTIKCAKSNEQCLHLENGIVLDFTKNSRLKWYIEEIGIDKNNEYPDLYNVYVNGDRQIIADLEHVSQFITEITRSE